MNVNGYLSRQAAEVADLLGDRRRMARVRAIVGAKKGNTLTAVRQLARDRYRLVLALEDALHRMTWDRDALGAPESYEQREARTILSEIRSRWTLPPRDPTTTLTVAARTPGAPTPAIPPAARPA